MLNTKARYIRKCSLGRSRLICQSPLTILLAIKLKYFYLGKSSTLQNTILSEESLIEELTGWLVSVCLQGQRFFFFYCKEKKNCKKKKQKNLQKSDDNDIFRVSYVLLLFTIILYTKCLLLSHYRPPS